MKPIYKKYLTMVALIWLGCAVLFLLVYVFALAPQLKTKKQIQEQLAEKKQIYDSARNAAQKGTQDRLSEEIKHLRDRLEDFVIDSEDLANLTFDISQIANEKGVGSFSISIADRPASVEAEKDNYLWESSIDISFTAGFNQFASVLNALERYQPVVFVDKFVIHRSIQNSSDHQVVMDVAVFVKKQQDS